MFACNWLRINNIGGFQLINDFAQRKFQKLFITKDN